MSKKRLLNFFAGLFFSLVWNVHADDSGLRGINFQYYKPSIDSFGTYTVNSPRLLNPGDWTLFVVNHWGEAHLIDIALDGEDVLVLDRLVTTDVILSLGLSSFLEAGFDLPVHVLIEGTNFDSLDTYSTQALGDIRTHFKFKLLQDKGATPGLALLVALSIPTGSETKLTGDNHVVPEVQLLLGKEFKYVDINLNIGARFLWQDSFLGVGYNDIITYGLGVEVPFEFWDPLLSFIGEVRGHFQPTDIRIVTAPVEFAAGLRKEFKNGVFLKAGAGGALNNALGNPRIRGLLEIGYAHAKARLAQPINKTKIYEPQTLSKSYEPVLSNPEHVQTVSSSNSKTTLLFVKNTSQLTTESRAWLKDFLRDSTSSKIHVTLHYPQTQNFNQVITQLKTLRHTLTQLNPRPSLVYSIQKEPSNQNRGPTGLENRAFVTLTEK